MDTLREKINYRMDALQNWMESNYHLEHPNQVMDLTIEVSKFWSVLSEEDRDYIQCAQAAIQEKWKWEV